MLFRCSPRQFFITSLLIKMLNTLVMILYDLKLLWILIYFIYVSLIIFNKISAASVPLGYETFVCKLISVIVNYLYIHAISAYKFVKSFSNSNLQYNLFWIIAQQTNYTAPHDEPSIIQKQWRHSTDKRSIGVRCRGSLRTSWQLTIYWLNPKREKLK